MSGLIVTATDFIELLGVRAAVQLFEEFGGVELYVPCPQHLTRKHAICQAIGIDAAQVLAAEFARTRVEVPMAKSIQRQGILDAVAAGEITKTKAARKLGLTTRRVRQIANGTGKDPNQLDLL